MLQLHWIKSSILPNHNIKSSAQNISKWTNHGHIYKDEVSSKCVGFNKLNSDQLQNCLAALNPAAPSPATILTSCNIALLPSTQPHQIQLQHYLAALNPAAPNLAATLPCCLQSNSIISSSQLSHAAFSTKVFKQTHYSCMPLQYKPMHLGG